MKLMTICWKKAIYDENDENFENGKVLFSDIQEGVGKT